MNNSGQAKFGMDRGTLQQAYDDEVRNLTLERFKAGETVLYFDCSTRHLLPKLGECLSLCGTKRFQKVNALRKMQSYDRAKFEALLPQLDPREMCAKCLEILKGTL